MQFQEIEGALTWKSIEKIEKGWSSDQKYKITTDTGEKLLLRISDSSSYEQKEKEYHMIQKFASCGFEMSKPIAFGRSLDGGYVYMLLTWLEGMELSEVLNQLSEKEQYRLGREAGSILRSMHQIPVADSDRPMKTHKEKKLLQLKRYEESPNLRVDSDETVITYVKKNIDKIWAVPAVYQHGDFHPGNLILLPDHRIGVIDFNRWDVGDPYEEFYKPESFGIESSIPYCIGQIQSYFNDQVPDGFWGALAVYAAHSSLFSIKWAEKFGQKSVDEMVERYLRSYKNYDGYQKKIPSWYQENKRMIVCLASQIGGSYKIDGKRYPTYLYAVNGMLEHLKAKWKENASVLVVSSAPDDYEGNDIKLRTFIEAFNMSGLSVGNMEFCDHRNLESVNHLSEYDAIILTGGHVPTQNAFFHEIQLRQKMEVYQGLVIGISAGTMNSADVVYAQPESEGESCSAEYQRFLEGLGLTNLMILPHYQALKDDILDRKRLFEDITYPDSFGREFYALVDGSYVWLEDGKTTLYGEAYRIKDGGILKICEKDQRIEL